VLIGGSVRSAFQCGELMLERPWGGLCGHGDATNSQSIQQVSSSMGDMLDVGMNIATGVTALADELFPVSG
jgi:hypothetical protein